MRLAAAAAAAAMAATLGATCARSRAPRAALAPSPPATAVPVSAPAPADPAPAPASAEDGAFTREVAPVLARRCAPCHVPGGSMYVKMPFDDPATVRGHREGILRRLKGDDNALVARWLGP